MLQKVNNWINNIYIYKTDGRGIENKKTDVEVEVADSFYFVKGILKLFELRGIIIFVLNINWIVIAIKYYLGKILLCLRFFFNINDYVVIF